MMNLRASLSFLRLQAAVVATWLAVSTPATYAAVVATREDQLAENIHAITAILKAENIAIPDDERLTHIILAALLQEVGVDPGLFPLPTLQSGADEKPPNFQWRTINDQVHYCVPGGIHEATANEITNKITELKPHVVILDLRYPGATTSTTASLLSNDSESGFHARPAMIVMINSKTSYSTELVAHMLAQRPGTVLVGQPSAGVPVPIKTHALNESVTFYLPDSRYKRFFDTWPPAPIAPDVLVDNVATVSKPPMLFSDELMSSNDPALQKALDLATAIIAFHPKNPESEENNITE